MNNANPVDAQDALSLNGRFYTISQMAELLNLSTNWFYERTRKNAIPFHKLGKHIRFTESDLTAILKMCSRGPHDENDGANPNNQPSIGAERCREERLHSFEKTRGFPSCSEHQWED
jgi:excisionase family DNA binding protein